MPRSPKFDDNTIKEKAKPGTRIHIPGTPCLYIFTSPKKGKRRWVFRFSQPDAKGVAVKSLGPYPHVTLEMAKNRAEQAYRALKVDKINLFEVDWNEGATTTFGEVAKQWLDNRFPSPSKQRREAEHMLFNHGKELLEKQLIRIKPKDVAGALRGLSTEMPDRFRRVLRRVEAVFALAKTDQLYFVENPAQWKGVQQNYFPGFKVERGHFDAMPYEKLPEFMVALRQHQSNSVAAVALEVTIYTACRTNEVLGMRWSEIDWDHKLWTIPLKRTKTGREYEVPLSDQVIKRLNMRKEYAVGELVFSAHRRNTPLDEKAMLNILHKIDDRYTVHGFRSSFSDWANEETHFAWDTIEECLSHKVGNAVRNAYRRRTGLKKRSKVMDAWAKYCG